MWFHERHLSSENKMNRLCVFIFLIVLSTLKSNSASGVENYDVDLSILDQKIEPCDDFYQFACGEWLNKTEIPNDRPKWSRSFSTIEQNNLNIMHTILKNASSLENSTAKNENQSNPYIHLLGDFFSACMDEDAIEKNALTEFKEQLDEIDKLQELSGLGNLVSSLNHKGANPLFDFGQEQDAKDSTKVIGYVDQGGLGLPDRDYYLSNEPKMKEIRQLYIEHIENIFKFLGDQQPEFSSAIIMKIETALAKYSMSRVDRRDPNKVYHRLERKGLIALTPSIDWNAYLNNLNNETTPQLKAINVTVPDFFKGLNIILKETSITDLKIYLKWHLITSVSEALPKKFSEERFRFVSTALSGQKSNEDRWKRCVRMTDRYLGFALGRSFVEETYGEESKVIGQKMIHEIEKEFSELFESLDWMNKSTKKAAQKKLAKIANKIGYPEVWKSYEGLKADRSSFLKSLEAAENFNLQYHLNKIGKPVDKNEWHMSPSTVNAYYDSQKNEIVFPAGILQYPFFNRESPDYLNYGAIGLVMGHELTHGFDDQGRQFDGEGNLKNWWNKNILKKFEQKTLCVENQYNKYEVLPGLYINGKLTLGENIADQGGMKISYRAWKAKQPKQSEKINVSGDKKELNRDQKFFIAFAQSWCQKEQIPYTRMRVTVDPHSPSQYRVNGVVSQFPPFAKAFNCPVDSKMAPTNRCEVW